VYANVIRADEKASDGNRHANASSCKVVLQDLNTATVVPERRSSDIPYLSLTA
jgi:hypothetical protein